MNAPKEGNSDIGTDWRRGGASQSGLKSLGFSLEATFSTRRPYPEELGWADQFLNQEIPRAAHGDRLCEEVFGISA